MQRALVWAILVMLAAMPAVSPTLAQPRMSHFRPPPGAGQVMPLDRILPHVRRAHPGTFFDAEGPVMSPHGGYHYRLKWMAPQGRVIWLNTDARTGRVVGVEGFRRRFPAWQKTYPGAGIRRGAIVIPPPPPGWPQGTPPDMRRHP